MKQTESGWKSRGMLLFAGIVMMIVGGMLPVQAEPPIHLSPGDILGGVLGGTVGALSLSNAPIRLQTGCSADLGKCWEAHGLNKENMEQVMDACWKETKKCPKVCRDEYFSRRKSGMSVNEADPLFRGRSGEETSCVPGVDALKHPAGNVKRE